MQFYSTAENEIELKKLVRGGVVGIRLKTRLKTQLETR